MLERLPQDELKTIKTLLQISHLNPEEILQMQKTYNKSIFFFLISRVTQMSYERMSFSSRTPV